MRNLVAHEAMEDEDEDALERVAQREHVGHEERLLVDVEQAKDPRRPEQHDQHKRSLQPRPEEKLRETKVIF